MGRNTQMVVRVEAKMVPPPGWLFDSGLCRRYPLVSQPVDILDDHDAVIHQHTDPQGRTGR